jgi:hypothetical protein
MSRQAREAFEEEITILRQIGGEIQETLESLERSIKTANNTSGKQNIACFDLFGGRSGMLIQLFWTELLRFGVLLRI